MKFPRMEISGNSSIDPVHCVPSYPYRTGSIGFPRMSFADNFREAPFSAARKLLAYRTFPPPLVLHHTRHPRPAQHVQAGPWSVRVTATAAMCLTQTISLRIETACPPTS